MTFDCRSALHFAVAVTDSDSIGVSINPLQDWKLWDIAIICQAWWPCDSGRVLVEGYFGQSAIHHLRRWCPWISSRTSSPTPTFCLLPEIFGRNCWCEALGPATRLPNMSSPGSTLRCSTTLVPPSRPLEVPYLPLPSPHVPLDPGRQHLGLLLHVYRETLGNHMKSSIIGRLSSQLLIRLPWLPEDNSI